MFSSRKIKQLEKALIGLSKEVDEIRSSTQIKKYREVKDHMMIDGYRVETSTVTVRTELSRIRELLNEVIDHVYAEKKK